MDFKKFLNLDKILLGITADDQKKILSVLIEPLSKENIVNDADVFLEDILRREAEITTVVENGVAIPHARSHAVTRLSLVVGITDGNGIAFNPNSDIKCNLFFCIAIPSFAPTSHIPLLQLLASFAHNPKRVEKLIQSKKPASVLKSLCTFKG